jgi:hypothetical protein
LADKPIKTFFDAVLPKGETAPEEPKGAHFSNMELTKTTLKILSVAILLIVGHSWMFAAPSTGSVQQPASAASKAIGTVKSISGSVIKLTTDSGTEVTVQVQDTTRLLRVAPGQDMKEAVSVGLQDIQTGDRILVRGKPGDSEKSIFATTIVAMKKADIAQKQQKDLQDWQRRGIGGLVKAMDPAAATITVSTMTASGAKDVVVEITPKTIIRRYSPDSVKFDDANPGTLTDTKVGDQLRARGDKNSDGAELTADEVVSGTFRNVAGIVTSVDPAKNTIIVNDLATKKPVTIRISGDSQMHKLMPQMAQHIAMRLKGANQSEGGPNATQNRQPGSTSSQHAEGTPAGAPGESGPRGNGGDIGQLLNRMPAMPFSELAKGDAVMIVATSGSTNSDATAISLLSGVEPILTASPNGSGAASLLAPWSLATGGAEAAAAGPQ